MWKGILCVTIASVMFGLTPLGNKYVVMSGMAAECIVVWQLTVMIFLAAALAKASGQKLKIPMKDAAVLILVGIIGIGGTDYFLNMAYTELQVSSVLMIHFLYPTFVLLVSVLLFHGRFTKLSGTAVLFCIAGLFLVTGLSGNITPMGAFYAAASGIVYGIYVLANDHGNTNRFHLAVKLFYTSIGGVLICGTLMLLGGSFSLPADGRTSLVLFAVVGAGSFLGFYLLTAGVKNVGATTAAFLNMLELIVAVAGGILMYGDAFSAKTGAGFLCILLSVLLITLDGVKK